jgi:hypothetical protein
VGHGVSWRGDTDAAAAVEPLAPVAAPRAWFREFPAYSPILMVTHDPFAASYCRRICSSSGPHPFRAPPDGEQAAFYSRSWTPSRPKEVRT